MLRGRVLRAVMAKRTHETELAPLQLAWHLQCLSHRVHDVVAEICHGRALSLAKKKYLSKRDEKC